jgi:hypothetical protein
MVLGFELQITQLRRLLKTVSLDQDSACAYIESRPSDFAQALISEALASDDVISEDDARSYFVLRADFFSAFLSDSTKAAVEAAFVEMLKEWDIP